MNTTEIKAPRLFLASCIALITTAMTFAFRASLEAKWGAEFQLSKQDIGWIFGPAFWGFTLAMVLGGPLCDWLGMKRLTFMAFFCHIAGIGTYLLASDGRGLFLGTALMGVGNGFVEAACNPLVTALYPKDKVKFLNRFHVWFPGGLVIGGLLAHLVLDRLQLDWRVLISLLAIPALAYVALFLNLGFPLTERVEKGIRTSEMFASCLNPLFIFMVACMLLTAGTELGTGSWINALLGGTGVSPILILVFISGIMALGRGFAGELTHSLPPTLILLLSALFSGLGLILLSKSEGYLAFLSAGVFAIGICYFWPTMLGFVAEYLPKTGPLGLSIMGGAGMLSVSFIVPFMGKLFDDNKAKAFHSLVTTQYQDLASTTLPEIESRASGTNLEAKLLNSINLEAGSETLFSVAVMPAILLVAFVILYFWMKKREANAEA